MLLFIIGTLLVSINFSLAADNVIQSNKKVDKTDKPVEVIKKSKKNVYKSKNINVKQKSLSIFKPKKSYEPQFVNYNKKELISKAKCSCGKKPYNKFLTSKFKNYCSWCKKSGQLVFRAHYEGEWTCMACGADYCLATGKEKLLSSKKKLKILT